MNARFGQHKPTSLGRYLSIFAVLILGSAANLSEAQEIVGTDTIGPRSSQIFTLRIPPDPDDSSDFGDTLPPGSSLFYQFAIFDTGSNTIGINNVETSDGTNTFSSTANILDLCAPGDVDCGLPTGSPPRVPGLPILDMRVWGLSRVNVGGGAPLDTPEAEIFGIVVRPSPIVTNLLGAPLGNNIVTHIDYTTVISHADIFVPGADITFYPPGDAGIPVPLYDLQLARFGNTTPTIEGATRGSFYSLVNFAFTNNGASAVTGDMLTLPDSSMRVARVFLDTGNTTTQITRPMAAALGIDPDIDPADDTVVIGTAGGASSMLNCYELSSAEFEGIGGTQKYVISSPLACVSDAAAFGTSSDPHDVILGTNYFEQTQILLDGPADTLGMYQGVASNNPPEANAGADRTVECDSMSGAAVMLDGSGSSDPDGDVVTYSWTGPFGTESGSNPTVTLAVGVHTVMLTVDDGNGATDTDEVQITVVDTAAPSLDAGPDITLEATSPSGATYDVSSQITASDTCSAVGIGISPADPYPLGDTVVTVTATDNSFNQTIDTMTVTVEDTTPPMLTVPGNIEVECDEAGGVSDSHAAIQAFLAGASATDLVDLTPAITDDAPSAFPLGSTIVTFTATDDAGNSASATAVVTVTDTTPPDLSLSVSPAVLWPPNHNMIPIMVTSTASDVCDPNPTVELILAESSEGDGTDTFDPDFDVTEVVGRKGNDIQIVDGQLYLRAERSGNSDGRVYTITFEATDASGNSTTAIATVEVPHNQ